VIVQALSRTVHRLREQGYTIVMVEQNFRFAAPLADRFYIMERGRVVEGFAARNFLTRWPYCASTLASDSYRITRRRP